MVEKILNWVVKNIGGIIIFVIVLIIIAPSFFSGATYAWLENCPLFRNVNFDETTGVIGDTIGGITAPFIGVLSIVLLYITFREQRKFNKETFEEQQDFNQAQRDFNEAQREFNKAQRSANDWTLLLEMKNTIEEHSEKVNFNLIFPENQRLNKENFGLDDIELLNTWTNGNGQISLEDFYKLYDEMLLISDLCILFYTVNNQSSLSDEIKKSFKNTIWHYPKKAKRFFTLCLERKLSVIAALNTIGDNPIEYKDKQTIKYIEFLSMYNNNGEE